MSLPVGISPLLDTSFLFTLARQLHAARNRLALRTAGNLPSIPELVLALRLYIARRDRDRALHAPPPPPPPVPPSLRLAAPAPAPATAAAAAAATDAPSIPSLVYYLALADAAYAASPADLEARLALIGAPAPLLSRPQAEKWRPGFFIARDRRHARIVVVVRGSKEPGDLVTNLSADLEPFLGGQGHQGIVRSAHTLHALVRAPLAAALRQYGAAGGVMVVGHSLGGAVAAALTMLLRTPALDREFNRGEKEGEDVRKAFRATRCFAYAAPPFVSEQVAREAREMGIVTLVAGFDLVPRLSAASLDRLLVEVARYNWGRDVSDTVGGAVAVAANGLLNPESARMVTGAVMQHGVTGISLASGALAHTARAALNDRRGAEQRSALWSLALNATAFVGGLVSDSVAGSRRRSMVDGRRRPDYAFARHFGMTEEDVERVLEDEAPREVYLAGVVYHLERPFTAPTERGEEGIMARSTLVRRELGYFKDIDPSTWMVHDHSPEFMMSALESLAG